MLAAAFSAVIVFFPPAGRIAGPLHELCAVLLGRATFMLPLVLAVLGVVLMLHGWRPDVKLPRRRFVGVGLIAIVVAASEELIARAGDGTGLVGEWLSASLVDLFGGPLTTVLLLVGLGTGILLAFDVKVPKPTPPRAADAEGQ